MTVHDAASPQWASRTTAAALPTRASAILVVILIPLLVTPWGSDAYNHVKALTVTSLAAVMAVGWVVAAVTTRRPTWRVTRPELTLWFLMLAVLVSSQTSVDLQLTVFGAPGRYEGLMAILAYGVLYFVGVHFFGTESGFATLVTASAWTALIAIGYGIAQVFLPPPFAGEAEIRQWYETFGVPRPPSTLGSPIVFGGYLAVMIPLLVAAALGGPARQRALWLLGSAAGYVAVLVTMTRAAWLAVVVGTAVVAAAIGRQMWRRHGVPLAAVMLAVAITGAVLLSVLTTPGHVADRASSSVAVQSGSLAQRVYIWDRTLRLVRERPWLGWGLETLREVFPYDRASMVHYFGPRPVIVDKAHNDVLQMAVSIGVPGAMAYALFWSLVVVSALRLWRRSGGTARVLAAGWLAAIVSYLVQAQFSFSAVALAPLVWLFAGAASGWEAGTATDGDAQARPSTALRAPASPTQTERGRQTTSEPRSGESSGNAN